MSSNKHPTRPDSRPTMIDLFSGAGGASLGFLRAGFRILGAVELNPNFALTYEKNLGVKVKTIDITNLPPNHFREELNLNPRDLDVLVGCPPCQGFSRMRNNEGAYDERNELVLQYLKFVEEFMPRFAVFENVPGLVRTAHGKKLYDLRSEGLVRLGYKIVAHEVNAADYGVAQRRKRVIDISGRDEEVPPFPPPTHAPEGNLEVSANLKKKWLSVRDIIGNGKYPELKAGESGENDGKFPNHKVPLTGRKVLSFIKKVPKDGGSRTDVEKRFWLQCHRSHSGHFDVYGRLAWESLANTMTCGCTNPSKGRFVHPEQDRALTPREAAALQGFPDNFVFHGKCIADQIGNAVPPPLASAIAEALKNRLCPLGTD